MGPGPQPDTRASRRIISYQTSDLKMRILPTLRRTFNNSKLNSHLSFKSILSLIESHLPDGNQLPIKVSRRTTLFLTSAHRMLILPPLMVPSLQPKRTSITFGTGLRPVKVSRRTISFQTLVEDLLMSPTPSRALPKLSK